MGKSLLFIAFLSSLKLVLSDTIQKKGRKTKQNRGKTLNYEHGLKLSEAWTQPISPGWNSTSIARINKKNINFPRNLEDELSFLMPIIMDQNFKKAQVFCNSRSLSDLVGMSFVWSGLGIKTSQYFNLLAAWLTKELKVLTSHVFVLKLNGENSQREKERVTNLFREG